MTALPGRAYPVAEANRSATARYFAWFLSVDAFMATSPAPGSTVPATRTLTAGAGLTGGGDLSADRTFAVTYGTTAGTAAQGNDSRIVGAAQTVDLGSAAFVATTTFDAAGTAAAAVAAHVAASDPHPQYLTATEGNAAYQPLDSDLTAWAGKIAPSGAAVGTTDAQALTNKDLTGAGNTFPTFNQNTTGSAAKLTTARTIDGQSFDGSANVTVIAPGTHAATSKTTPVDADELPLVDSAASNVLKKLTWANLKATLKSYFDTLYVAIPGAWTAYTPTVTPGSGSFTAASATGRWQKIGKTVVGSIKITITTNGTAAGYVRCTTPIAVRDNYSCLGRETAVNGNFLFCNAQSGGDFIILLPDQTYPGVNGAVLEFTFTYETT